jgi:hypothetical protein
MWAFAWSELTLDSKPIAAFDDAANQQRAPHLPVSLSLGF